MIAKQFFFHTRVPTIGNSLVLYKWQPKYKIKIKRNLINAILSKIDRLMRDIDKIRLITDPCFDFISLFLSLYIIIIILSLVRNILFFLYYKSIFNIYL